MVGQEHFGYAFSVIVTTTIIYGLSSESLRQTSNGFAKLSIRFGSNHFGSAYLLDGSPIFLIGFIFMISHMVCIPLTPNHWVFSETSISGTCNFWLGRFTHSDRMMADVQPCQKWISNKSKFWWAANHILHAKWTNTSIGRNCCLCYGHMLKQPIF